VNGSGFASFIFAWISLSWLGGRIKNCCTGDKEAGKIRAKGKEYVVKDGDALNFLLNVSGLISNESNRLIA
jgi:hypothetical protein